MPSLSIKPPRPPSSEPNSSSPAPPSSSSFSFAPPITTTYNNPYQDAASPVAPEYSPITPKVQPALPAILPDQDGGRPVYEHAPPPAQQELSGTPTAHPTEFPGPIAPATYAPPPPSAIPPTQYIAPPPPHPFSSEDSTDAIALRSAISALQFQKKKAQDDIRTLESTRKLALDDPLRFRNELAAGRLKEQKPEFGGLQAILDAADSDEGDEGEEGEAGRKDSVRAIIDGATNGNGDSSMKKLPDRSAEVPDSEPSLSQALSSAPPTQTNATSPAPYARVPGPQNVIRMPYINWDKYHVVGESLDAIHEQQRRWPGSTAYGQDRGREFVVAAPYSPFYDTLDGAEGAASRKDSVAVSTPAMATTPTGTISEHPMETRRSSKN